MRLKTWVFLYLVGNGYLLISIKMMTDVVLFVKKLFVEWYQNWICVGTYCLSLGILDSTKHVILNENEDS